MIKDKIGKIMVKKKMKIKQLDVLSTQLFSDVVSESHIQLRQEKMPTCILIL